MFSVLQKRMIADAVQRILRATDHPELPEGEIKFHLHVEGDQPWSWADIQNNGAVDDSNPYGWNEHYENPNYLLTLGGTLTGGYSGREGARASGPVDYDWPAAPGPSSRG